MQSAKLAPALAAVVPATTALASSHSDSQQERKLKVVVTGGHPGDPECGCGGTAARYADLGHEVVLLYLNRGEGFCGRNDLKDCARIRTSEAEKACAILKARPVFVGQYDGRSVVDPSHYQEFLRILNAETPDLVFTQWPVDSHRDHRAISALVLDAWLASNKKFVLYYYEVAEDTLMFSPTEYVDTSAVESRHRAACYAHASQDPDKWYPLQKDITRYRGLQNGWQQAEAFLRLSPGVSNLVLPCPSCPAKQIP